ncbi:unnamed protein product [Polarella glacialis]|uniref:JmjC domain-containing protein n=1 Tax=Polarella glacialis TaxID=89957 RepID=A0A813LZ26_POLGL|nr:unnamed protein product [Polarella glacialis]
MSKDDDVLGLTLKSHRRVSFRDLLDGAGWDQRSNPKSGCIAALRWPLGPERQGTWRVAYSNSLTPAGKTSAAGSDATPSAKVYSDVLYRSFFFAAADLKASWLQGQNMQRVDARGLSAEEFVRRFEQTSTPVILKGAAERWPAMKSWSQESLVKRFGKVQFACGACDWPLDEFYAYARSNIDDVPQFIFDKYFVRRAPELLEEYDVPDVFKGRDLFDLVGTGRPDFRWLLIGDRRSGSKWHLDPNKTSAWNAVVKGRKHWLMLPPGCPPPGVHPTKDGSEVTQPLSLIEWFVNFYSELKRMARENPAFELKEGTCGPGEVVFVPCGWWHCVLNLDDDTIAVTQNYASETHVHGIRRFLCEKRGQYKLISGLALCTRKNARQRALSLAKLGFRLRQGRLGRAPTGLSGDPVSAPRGDKSFRKQFRYFWLGLFGRVGLITDNWVAANGKEDNSQIRCCCGRFSPFSAPAARLLQVAVYHANRFSNMIAIVGMYWLARNRSTSPFLRAVGFQASTLMMMQFPANFLLQFFASTPGPIANLARGSIFAYFMYCVFMGILGVLTGTPRDLPGIGNGITRPTFTRPGGSMTRFRGGGGGGGG